MRNGWQPQSDLHITVVLRVDRCDKINKSDSVVMVFRNSFQATMTFEIRFYGIETDLYIKCKFASTHYDRRCTSTSQAPVAIC